MKTRSDCITQHIETDVIKLLKETSLSCTIIGKKFNCSRGPIWTIQEKNSIKRPFNPKTKHFPKPCKWCREIKAKPGFSKTRPNRGKFCSKECYTLWQKTEDNKGSSHPNWIDGGKHEDYLNHLRKTDEWRNWREQVFARDDHICQLCNNKGGILHPHHIKQKCDFPELIFDINNGITLCKECHKSKGVHSYRSNLYKLFLGIIVRKQYVCI